MLKGSLDVVVVIAVPHSSTVHCLSLAVASNYNTLSLTATRYVLNA